MKSVVRGGWVVLVALTLLTQLGRLAAEDAAVVADVDGHGDVVGAGLPGLAPLPPGRLVPPAAWSAMADGCNEPVTMTHIGFNGAGLETVDALRAHAAETRYVYLGLVRRRPDTVSMLARWAAANGLHAVGLRRDPAPRAAVLVAWSPTCPALASWDWSRLSPWR